MLTNESEQAATPFTTRLWNWLSGIRRYPDMKPDPLGWIVQDAHSSVARQAKLGRASGVERLCAGSRLTVDLKVNSA